MMIDEETQKILKDLRGEIRDLKDFVKVLYSMIMEEDEEYAAGTDVATGLDLSRFSNT